MSLAEAARNGPPSKRIAKQARNARILVWDIETAPALSYHFGMFGQNIGLAQMVEPGSMLCFAARWYGEKESLFYSVHHDGRTAMLDAAWNLLHEADAVVSYNGAGFDSKWVKGQLAADGYAPPSPWREIDLYRVVKREFNFTSKKLDAIAGELGIGHKVAHSGFDLWKRCMEGDDKAWATMRKYNLGDIDLTLKLFDRLRPWLGGVVNMAVFGDEDRACPNCGSTELVQDGWTYTAQTKYARLRCKRCRSWARANYIKHRAVTRSVR